MEVDYNPSRKTLISNKWIATAASIWIQCTSGSHYTFSIYSSILKSTQGYDQSTLAIVSVYKDLGANVGLLAGIFYSIAAVKVGPWVVLLAGAVQNFAGYFLMWLTVTGALPRPPVSVMCVYMLLSAHSVTFFSTANLVTGVHNFPDYSGTIVGIMLGFLGLSGAILIQVYQTIFKNKSSSYLLLLALLPTSTSLLLMGFVKIFKTNEENERRHLNRFSFLAMILAAYITAVIIIKSILKLNLPVRIGSFVLLIVLLLSVVSVSIDAQRDKRYRMLKSLLENNQIQSVRDFDEDMSHNRQDDGEYHEIPNGDPISETNDASLHRRELNIFQAMGSISFWFLLFTTACAIGSGLSTVNNISQIGESLGYSILEINTMVSLWSIWNFLGRFGSGYVSDYFLHARGCPRPLFIVMTLVAMSIGHIVIAFGLPGSLYVGSILIGVGYGSQWSLMPTIASDLFGKVDLGTIFNTITIAGPVVSYILSVTVIGRLYDKESSGSAGTCIGTHCFKLGFIIMALVTFTGSLVALALFLKTRNFYKHLQQRLLFSLRQSKLMLDIE